MARYIIREGTVRGQGRYWCGWWSNTDKFRYMGREQTCKRAAEVGGRVVRLVAPSERLRAKIVEAMRIQSIAHSAKKEGTAAAALLDMANRIERGEVG